MNDDTEKFNGVVMAVTLAICGLLFWQHPPAETRQASRLVRDPVTGVEVSGRAVIMISKQGCAPCEQLKRETLPQAREAGYETTIVEQPAERYPTCRIFDGRRWQTRVGFFRWSKPSQAEVEKYIKSNGGSSPPKSWYKNGDPWRNLTAEEANKTFERVGE